MKFNPEFFQKIEVKNEQIESLLRGAKRNLELALDSKENEIVLHFCYTAIIKLGVYVLAKNGYKVRSIPGHHVNILKAISDISGLKNELKYIDNIRRKRNIDLYEGEISLSDKESSELIEITNKNDCNSIND